MQKNKVKINLSNLVVGFLCFSVFAFVPAEQALAEEFEREKTSQEQSPEPQENNDNLSSSEASVETSEAEKLGAVESSIAENPVVDEPIVDKSIVEKPSADTAKLEDKMTWYQDLGNSLSYLPWHKVNLGLGVGQSTLEPEFSNVYEISDDKDVGLKLWLDYSLRHNLALQFQYAKLGQAEIKPSQGAISQLSQFNSGQSFSVKYANFSTSALYEKSLQNDRWPGLNRWSVIGKLGLAYSDIKSNVQFLKVDKLSPLISGGLQYRFIKPYLIRVEYESFNKDSKLLSVSFSKRLREEEKLPPELKKEEIVVAETEEEIEVEPSIEEDVAMEVVQKPASLDVEESIAGLDSLLDDNDLESDSDFEPNMEELFAELKKDMRPYSLFEKGSADISENLIEGLGELVYFLDSYPYVQVVITGHACDVGHEYVNENLSRLRSHGVKSYLQANGINGSRIVAKGRGEDFPRYKNTNEENRVKNRRVNFDFYIKKE